MRKDVVLKVGYTVQAHPPTEEFWYTVIEAGLKMARYFDFGDDDVELEHVEEAGEIVTQTVTVLK